MKVETMQEILESSYASSVKKNEEGNREGFGKILEDTLNTNSEIEADEKNISTPGLSGIGDVQAMSFPMDNEAPVYEHTNQLLDVLDEYRNLLADHSVPTEDIQPIVDKLSDQTDRLSTGLKSLPEGSPLKDIVNQALIVSSSEVVKFGRGDYGPA